MDEARPDVLFVHGLERPADINIPMGAIGIMNDVQAPKLGLFDFEVKRERVKQAQVLAMDLHWFFTLRHDMHHDRLQKFVIIDYTKEMVINAVIKDGNREVIAGMGQYIIQETTMTAEVAFIVKDGFQNRGIGTELLTFLTYLARRQGLAAFTAEVLFENKPMLHVFEKSDFIIEKRGVEGVYEMRLDFRE